MANTELIDYKTLCESHCASYASLVTYVLVYCINMEMLLLYHQKFEASLLSDSAVSPSDKYAF